MDARTRRTAEALRTAVLEVAALTPIDEVSVSSLCRAAGISRDTFYRHAESPIALLARVLDDDLREIVEVEIAVDDAAGTPAPPRRSVFEEPERQLLSLVGRHAEVLRRSLKPRLPAALRDVFIARMETGLVEHLARHPQIAPPEAATDAGRRVLAAYAAAGTVGAIETLLASDSIADTERAVALVLAASAEWWHGR